MIAVERGDTEDAFELAVTPTVPLPVPEDGASVAQVAPLDAVQEQLLPLVVTAIRPVPPADPYGLPEPDASRLTLQDKGCSVIWKGCPPIEMVPERRTVVELGAVEYTSVPGPVPEPPEVIEIQLGPVTVL